jgi:hypothetical protein
MTAYPKHRPGGRVRLPGLRQRAGCAARPRERPTKAERGTGSAAAALI